MDSPNYSNKFVPYNSREEAQLKIDAINEKYLPIWQGRADNYSDIIIAENGYFVIIISGYESEFTELELSNSVDYSEIILTTNEQAT